MVSYREKEEDEEVRLDDGDIDFGCDVRYSRGSSLGSGDRRSSAGDFAAAVGSSATSSSYMDEDKDEDDAEDDDDDEEEEEEEEEEGEMGEENGNEIKEGTKEKEKNRME